MNLKNEKTENSSRLPRKSDAPYTPPELRGKDVTKTTDYVVITDVMMLTPKLRKII